MKRRTSIVIIALVLLLVALCGWAVEGVRWALAGSRPKRLAPAS